MGYLSKLKIVTAARRTTKTPQEHRKEKLIERLEEQLGMAEAFLKGETYTKTRRVYLLGEDGIRHQVERPKRLKPWWSHDTAGCYQFTIRYGARTVELQKGRTAVEVGKKENIPTTIRTVIEAVRAGELDDAISVVADLTRPQTKRKTAA